MSPLACGPGLLATPRLQRRGSPAQSLAAQSWVALEQSSTCSVVARRSRRYSVSRSSSLSAPSTSSSTAASASFRLAELGGPGCGDLDEVAPTVLGRPAARNEARRSRGRSRAPPGWSCRSGAWPPVPAGRSRRDRAAASGRRDCADAARALRAQLGHALASGAPDGRAARKNDCATPESWWQERWVKSRRRIKDRRTQIVDVTQSFCYSCDMQNELMHAPPATTGIDRGALPGNLAAMAIGPAIGATTGSGIRMRSAGTPALVVVGGNHGRRPGDGEVRRGATRAAGGSQRRAWPVDERRRDRARSAAPARRPGRSTAPPSASASSPALGGARWRARWTATTWR